MTAVTGIKSDRTLRNAVKGLLKEGTPAERKMYIKLWKTNLAKNPKDQHQIKMLQFAKELGYAK